MLLEGAWLEGVTGLVDDDADPNKEPVVGVKYWDNFDCMARKENGLLVVEATVPLPSSSQST